MAKRINILSAGSTIPFADNGLKLSKSIKLSEIEYHDEFKSLFSIDEKLLKRIADSMGETKYDNSQPIHIWIYTDETGTTHNYLIDGHTRVKAAELAGFETVPYFEHKFNTFEEAYRYVLGLQVNRRNLEGAELLRNISKLYETDFIQNTEGKKSEAIAELIGVSDRTVEKGLFVNKNADEETMEKIDAGELSVDKAYKEIKRKEKTDKNKKEEVEDIEELSESLEDNSGNPRALNFSNLIRKTPEPRMTPEEDNERTKERRQAYLNGMSDGFYKALVFACAEISKGRTPEEVYKDERVRDISPVVIDKFSLPEDSEEIVGRW